ncbi:NADH-cytochrome b5 reductase-like protein [Hondaea fermentalgiana]|uniref:fumarate reductase (NADH) n=1 Tax=Hondaea fermentalgiana TaxID=2315210 RepID=A0A2R5GRK2_9STRA|nr:NADH-cytochrome b5 reductase-like protein [Hondaea fermentalgiana]|eukprot:GBG33225.1 NADH-cytochrome b5 reductase-like protein [Hondaea fermentalgiana]
MPDGDAKASRVVGSVAFERPTQVEEHVASDMLMVEGTRCAMHYKIKFYAPPGDGGGDDEAQQQVQAVCKQVFDETEATFSLWVEDSELSKINNMKEGETCSLSGPMQTVLYAASEMYSQTRGAYDPAFRPLLDHYVAAAQKRIAREDSSTDLAKEDNASKEAPKDWEQKLGERAVSLWRSLLDRGFGDQGGISRAVEQVRAHASWQTGFQLSEDQKSLTKILGGARLDLNGIAKGWAIDAIVDRLKSKGFTSAFVDWAGDIKVLGTHADGRPWTVAVAEPPSLGRIEAAARRLVGDGDQVSLHLGRDLDASAPNEDSEDVETSYLAVLELRPGQAVATSGDYEQVFRHRGRLYSHVLDPRKATMSLINEESLAQTTVVCGSAMYADALATASLAVRSPPEARALLDPFRTAFHKPLSDFLLYARAGPRVVKLAVPGVERKESLQARWREHEQAKVVVVGAGLAGFSAAIEAADAGASVVLLEKEARTGGNSAKATSGINGWGTSTQAELAVADREALFERDTHRSGKGGNTNQSLVRTLSTKSAPAIAWLKERFHVPLTVLSQLGGHSTKRTHRAPPDEHGNPVPIGYLIMKTLREAVEANYQDKIEIRTSCRATKLEQRDGRVCGVHYEQTSESGKEDCLIEGDAVILTTGGFGCDKSNDSLLKQHRPDLEGIPTTNGPFATGDGVRMGVALGANLIDMDKVQLHPTGFIDPKDPGNPTKFLAPEAIRGSGGILVNSQGRRFVDELNLRSVVAAAIQKNCDPYRDGDFVGLPFAWVILSQEAQELFGPPTLGFYKDRLGLFEACDDIDACAACIGCDPQVLKETVAAYETARSGGICEQTGKMVFPSNLTPNDTKLVLARVTPSIHYTMGGLDINASGEVQVLIADSVIGHHRHIPGLFAAGEVTGGVHGANRLGGNSLLECVVFGRIAGERAATIRQPKTSLFVDKAHETSAGWVPCVLRETRNTDFKYGKNTREIRFNLHGSLQSSGLEVGQYVALRGELDGETLQGFFSPVTRPGDEGVIGILCRFDERGGPIYKLLQYIRPGSVLQMKAMGGLRIKFSDEGMEYAGRPIRRLGLLSAGTGVAPMVQIIREYVHCAVKLRKRGREDLVAQLGANLLYAAEEEDDLAFVKCFEDLCDKFPQDFRYYCILNKPPLGWTEGVGFIKPSNIRSHVFFPPADDQLIVICGPPIFERIMVRTLLDLGFSRKHFYAYSDEDGP